MHFHKATATPAIYLLMGVPPGEAQVYIFTITLFTNVLRHGESIEYRLIEIERQLVMKPTSPTGLCRVCSRGIEFASSLPEHKPEKERWKRKVKVAVLGKRKDDLKKESEVKSMLALLNLNLDICDLHTVQLARGVGTQGIFG